MESIIISGEKKDIRLLITIAEKMGLDVSFIEKQDLEDSAIAEAIKGGETGELVDINEFVESLK